LSDKQDGRENMKKHVVVLCGGRSAEHDISFLSASSVLNTLDRRKYRVTVLGIRKDGTTYSPQELKERLRVEPDRELRFSARAGWIAALLDMPPAAHIVFPLLHGPYGEDGTVQGLLEVLDLPYVGAGVWGSAVGMNKIHSKIIFRQAGLPVLPYLSLDRRQWEDSPERHLGEVEQALSYPVFVKPANLGSSIGINKAHDRSELFSHLQTAFRYDDFIVIEQGVEAREIELSVLGNLQPRVSIAGEIIPSREFYSYESKYLDDSSQLLIPAPITEEQLQRARELALQGYQALQLEGMARMDFLMDKDTGELWINEPNTIPGFTRISMYPKLWEASGLPYVRLLDELIDLGLERHRRRCRLSVDR
jgi:D-alanine-D-alanine ligase